jgi:hypothetical protein
VLAVLEPVDLGLGFRLTAVELYNDIVPTA